jgi:GT2 family glycosyltransferase
VAHDLTSADILLCMRFSHIVVTKDRPDAVRSVLKSSLAVLPSGSEIIVVDGDPGRSAHGVSEELAAAHSDASLRYVPSEPGMTLQRNVGIDLACGDIVLFTDDDCLLMPNLFDALMEAYRDPGVVGVTGQIIESRLSRLGSNTHSRLRRILVGGGREGTMTSFGFRRPIVRVHEPHDVEYMPGPLMSARRALAAEVRFDERLAAYGLGEDDDFSYRLSRQGRIRYEPSAAVHHNELGWRGMDRRERDRRQVINRAYLFHKNFPSTPCARAGFAALLSMMFVHRALNREWAGLRGLAEGLWHVSRSKEFSLESAATAGTASE